MSPQPRVQGHEGAWVAENQVFDVMAGLKAGCEARMKGFEDMVQGQLKTRTSFGSPLLLSAKSSNEFDYSI